MTVGQLRREMTAAEYARWIGFYNWEAGERKRAEREQAKGQQKQMMRS